MKYILCTAAVLASISGLVNANDGIYASVKAGISDTKFKSSTYNIPEDEDFYINNNQTKSVYPTISVAAGYDFSTISPVDVRAELEYTYKGKTTFDPSTYENIYEGESWGEYPSNISNELTSQLLMLNGYYDFKNTSKFTPYVSAGVGFTHVKNKQTNGWGETSSDSDNHFTWSAGVGVNYAVSKNVGLDLSYRYVDAGKFKFNNLVGYGENLDTNVKLQSNEYLVGVRYNF